MEVRKAIALIKRQDIEKVIINSRLSKLNSYEKTKHNLEDILINDSNKVEIILSDKIIEIPENNINQVVCEATYVVFYEEMRVILFNFKY
ncbi:hypothetical protein [Terrisporobacter sp.]|uniref:hypothetical protein n=1 Tax=Terrisporobacter sp. TaxID=1965305 RepID=UPI0026374148|nr:hypothetical protein [Terrisporobacter sp.]